MTGRFADKVVLVTGAGTGIGRATACRFAQEGATVVVAGRRLEPLRETVSLIESDGGKAQAFQVDVTREDDVARLIDTIVIRNGGLDAACNNAGVPGSGKASDRYDLDHWRRIVDTNLQGVWLSMKHEIAHMRANAGGAIVNVASIAGIVGYYHSAPYTASKHGVVGLSRAAAIDHATEGIRVNAVCPGPISTPMLIEAKAARGPAADDFYLSHIPMGRLGRPEEVAHAVVWLASTEAAYVTGQALAVDGGWTAQ
ncbi:glucose 1-dehydrogenase [Mycolicibacterium pulveris]|uniref:Short chain dehydrogenase n=1 Tax=Mycolicibacterium pulveris TaxID=36813 RepID=A0A7I7UL00_MYCPV|nr:glucose 1-dehydrogenase [Mycolicibacterium pulveris]MCV6980569.1 glucose 1-dehydrogenase [Mycolicibacterium pulveris]BBY81967.1 short chain dehydrogenase [Mycolicibacterium pulveris]